MWRNMTSWILVNIASGTGLLSNDTNPLPKTMLNVCQLDHQEDDSRKIIESISKTEGFLKIHNLLTARETCKRCLILQSLLPLLWHHGIGLEVIYDGIHNVQYRFVACIEAIIWMKSPNITWIKFTYTKPQQNTTTNSRVFKSLHMRYICEYPVDFMGWLYQLLKGLCEIVSLTLQG